MATRSAAANRTDPRAVTGRVHVWKRVLVPVSEATNNLASFMWVQTGNPMPRQDVTDLGLFACNPRSHRHSCR